MFERDRMNICACLHLNIDITTCMIGVSVRVQVCIFFCISVCVSVLLSAGIIYILHENVCINLLEGFERSHVAALLEPLLHHPV